MNIKYKITTIFISLILFTQISARQKKNVDNYQLSNGINVISYSHFDSNQAQVSIVFHIGNDHIQQRKSGILHLIIGGFIDKEEEKKLLSLGITVSKSIRNNHCQLQAIMHQKKLEAFLRIISQSIQKINLEKINLIKNHMTIHHKMDDYFGGYNNVDDFAFYKNPININTLLKITNEDVIDFFENTFRKNMFSIMVIGNHKKSKTNNFLNKYFGQFEKRISIETIVPAFSNMQRYINSYSVYNNTSITYSYLLPKSSINYELFMIILENKLFDHFYINNNLLKDYQIRIINKYGEQILIITLTPTFDVSLNELQNHYEIFKHKLNKLNFTNEENKDHKKIIDHILKLIFSDQSYIQDYIMNHYFLYNQKFSKNIKTNFNDISNIEKEIRNFSFQSPLDIITTQFKLDK